MVQSREPSSRATHRWRALFHAETLYVHRHTAFVHPTDKRYRTVVYMYPISLRVCCALPLSTMSLEVLLAKLKGLHTQTSEVVFAHRGKITTGLCEETIVLMLLTNEKL